MQELGEYEKVPAELRAGRASARPARRSCFEVSGSFLYSLGARRLFFSEFESNECSTFF